MGLYGFVLADEIIIHKKVMEKCMLFKQWIDELKRIIDKSN